MSTDSLDSHHEWTRRLRLPYPLASDPDRTAGEALGLVRRIGIGGWRVEFFRRTTLLVGVDGRVAGLWGQVRVRGHAAEALRAARAAGVVD